MKTVKVKTKRSVEKEWKIKKRGEGGKDKTEGKGKTGERKPKVKEKGR